MYLNGPQNVGPGSGANPSGGVNNDKFEKAKERLANFNDQNKGLSIFGSGALGFSQPGKVNNNNAFINFKQH